jgi:hypothetical protein
MLVANSIRAAILSGSEGARPDGLIAKKRKRPAAGGESSLTAIPVKREEARHSDQRRDQRHSNLVERGHLVWRDREIEVPVVNISPGGVMIEAPGLDPAIGEPVQFRIDGCDPARCRLCWVKGDRIGLEFAHETTIEGPSDIRNFIIQSLRSDAPDLHVSDPQRVQVERAPRQRLIWEGSVHYDHDSTAARVRNISSEGAMIECDWDFHVGTEVLLDLEQAGTVFAIVRWCQGGQIGLKFNTPFDLRGLAECKPKAAESVPAHSFPNAAPKPRPNIRRGKRLSVSEIADLFR